MNPRRRRLLIPGLLVTLVVVVLVVSLSRAAQAADGDTLQGQRVSTISDGRITESSGLAVSQRFADIGYTINDSGNTAQLYAIKISTGEVVGTTSLTNLVWTDPEALALDGSGGLWIADTGDNDARRLNASLYRIKEPGPGDRQVAVETYPIRYQYGPVDVESLAIDPDSGRKILVTKEAEGGRLLELPANLSTETSNAPVEIADGALSLATDAAWSPDGQWIVVRSYGAVQTIKASTAEGYAVNPVPPQPQGETIAFDSASTFLLGSEGADSELVRYDFFAPPKPDDGSTSSTDGSNNAFGMQGGSLALEGNNQKPWVMGTLATLAPFLMIGLAWYVLRRDPERSRTASRRDAGRRKAD